MNLILSLIYAIGIFIGTCIVSTGISYITQNITTPQIIILGGSMVGSLTGLIYVAFLYEKRSPYDRPTKRDHLMTDQQNDYKDEGVYYVPVDFDIKFLGEKLSEWGLYPVDGHDGWFIDEKDEDHSIKVIVTIEIKQIPEEEEENDKK